ncbi:MAG: VCBS repeat-containing protein, partial [Chloroflexota bacterium]|nr:VCBS repeat-containing protein [Chloroflexota bacterium]
MRPPNIVRTLIGLLGLLLVGGVRAAALDAPSVVQAGAPQGPYVACAGPLSFQAAPGSPVAVGSHPQSVATADFNGDGRLDLATANGWADSVTVLLGTGMGGFSPAPGSPFAVGGGPISLAAADFNGDGHPDLAILNLYDYTVTVVLGTGSGAFTAAPGSPFALGGSPQSVVAADFNGDGFLDLAFGNYENRVTVLLGTGTGGFSPAPGSPFAVGSRPILVAAVDFNGDGRLDLATANQGDNTVTVLLGTARGGFSPAPGSPFGVSGSPRDVAAADFNGDGYPDLALPTRPNPYSTNVTVLLGDGLGGLSPAPGSPFAVGDSMFAVAVADFNGDNHPDLAVTDVTYYSTAVVLLGDGGGGFSAATSHSVGRSPYSLVTADFNGDGQWDLATASYEDSNVTVLLNSCTAVTATPTATGTLTPATGTPTRTPPPSGTATGTAVVATPTGTPTPPGTGTLTAVAGTPTGTPTPPGTG